MKESASIKFKCEGTMLSFWVTVQYAHLFHPWYIFVYEKENTRYGCANKHKGWILLHSNANWTNLMEDKHFRSQPRNRKGSQHANQSIKVWNETALVYGDGMNGNNLFSQMKWRACRVLVKNPIITTMAHMYTSIFLITTFFVCAFRFHYYCLDE